MLKLSASCTVQWLWISVEYYYRVNYFGCGTIGYRYSWSRSSKVLEIVTSLNTLLILPHIFIMSARISKACIWEGGHAPISHNNPFFNVNDWLIKAKILLIAMPFAFSKQLWISGGTLNQTRPIGIKPRPQRFHAEVESIL